MSAFFDRDLSRLAPCSACQESFLTVETLGVPRTGKCLHHICAPCFERLNPRVCPLCRVSIKETRENVQMQELITSFRDHLFKDFQKPGPTIDAKRRAEAIREKMKAFIDSTWEPDSTHANHITAGDLDFLWHSYVPRIKSKESEGDDALFYAVLDKIYNRLCIFYTGDCAVSDRYGVTIANLTYRNLCHIAAQKKAADRGNLIAQYCLGYCYLYGIHVPVNNLSAKSYLESSSEGGIALAHHSLGSIYETEKNYVKAIECYTKGVDSNCYDSCVALGNLYLKGDEVEQNIPKGVALLKAAASANHVRALVALADYYAQLDGKTPEEARQNQDLAKEYYVLASSRGHENSEDRAESIQRLQTYRNNGGCAVM